MSQDPDWSDPYTGDEDAARDRERRRAEREARRRERLGNRVKDGLSPPPQASEPTAERTAVAAPPAQPPVDAATEVHASPPPPPPPPRPPRSAVARRRLLALFGLAALVFVAFVVVVAAQRLGGEEAQPAPAAEGAQDDLGHDPRGLQPRSDGRRRQGGGSRGRLHEGHRELQGLRSLEVRRRGPPEPGGLPVPRDVRDLQERHGRRPGAKAARGVRAEHRAGRPLLREVEAAQHLRRGQDRLDDRARGAGARGARQRLVGDLQPPRRRAAAGDRRDDPLRGLELRRAAPRIAPGRGHALQHAHQHGPAAGPIGSPGADSLDAAANPADTDYLFFVVKPGTCGEHVFTETEEEFFAAEDEYQAALQAEGGSPTDC